MNRDIATYGDDELKAISKIIAANITIRATENEVEFTRKSYGWEETAIYNVAFGTLIECRFRYNPEAIDPALHTAENILDEFLPHCNGYMTLFTKLDKLLVINKGIIEIREDYLDMLRKET